MYDAWWGHITLLHAELSCMRDLLQFDWLYMVNMAAQMFPLRTNHEIVKITKLLGGANDVQGLV
jgi:beta-1,3-galactosyl-O-glycosyl-glycoprotein beta-1,6-N-acetylglucosaminyltransferase